LPGGATSDAVDAVVCFWDNPHGHPFPMTRRCAMANPLLDHLGELILTSSHAIVRMWRQLGDQGSEKDRQRDTDTGAADVSAVLDVVVPMATSREAEVQAYWRLVKAELARGMPSDDARPLLVRASEVIGSWETLSAVLSRAIASVNQRSGQEYAAPAFSAAVARTKQTLDAIRRAVAQISGLRPEVDQARLEAGRKAVTDGRYTRVKGG
jgi:hypothetical protein